MALVVLDRHGVLQPANQSTPGQGNDAALADIAAALARLSNQGFTLVVASNEPGIGQGATDLDELQALHLRLSERVENRGGTIAAFFYCPHTAAQHCHCRKPATGLIDAIELEFATPANDMIMITDNLDDLTLATTIGATPLLVLTEAGRLTQSQWQGEITCVDSLAAAVDHVIKHH